MIYNGLRMQGLSWGVPVVTGDMSMGRGIVLAALCIPLAARRGPLQSPMRQLLRSRLLCILTLCEQVPNGHYTKTAASQRLAAASPLR